MAIQVCLNSGQKMPVIGMGTCSFPPAGKEATVAAIVEAIRAGYRHFDTAHAYGTESFLGEAVAKSIQLGLIQSRSQLHITTKLWCNFATRDKVVPALKNSLMKLEMDYVDLYLIHWPLGLTREALDLTPPLPREMIVPLDMKSVWEAMEETVKLGLARSIGVSNFSIDKLRQILTIASIPPAVNQVEMNPLWRQEKLREYCNEQGIHITAYSPLGANGTMWGDNRILDSDIITDVAKAREKTPAQVALRWVYEHGVSFVSKSFNEKRMRENMEIFDWSLTKEEFEKINTISYQCKGVKLSAFFGAHDIVLEIDAEI
ncbi:D-galacturonate reductase-like [Impatiens glandulifera]|uniref:D-galacturonate reductase-like n=1 Tax=Impatiens glandulifera TaxID=253017 RepID=UPI001FB0AD58|nr:D-galacturonate reductase-like [Impatiens glandulifera]